MCLERDCPPALLGTYDQITLGDFFLFNPFSIHNDSRWLLGADDVGGWRSSVVYGSLASRQQAWILWTVG